MMTHLYQIPEGKMACPDQKTIHIWQIFLIHLPERIESLYRILSLDEQQRASHYRFTYDRSRFITGRSALRLILSEYLNISPNQIQFQLTPYGKPYLYLANHSEKINFNLTHSRDLILFAFTSNRRIGIDIEYMDDSSLDLDIARFFFSEQETEKLRSAPPSLQKQAFYTCWVRKEAYIKARGEGLSYPLDQFITAFLPWEEPALLETLDDSAEAKRWSLKAIPTQPGYTAALAVEGRVQQIQYWQWKFDPCQLTY